MNFQQIRSGIAFLDAVEISAYKLDKFFNTLESVVSYLLSMTIFDMCLAIVFIPDR